MKWYGTASELKSCVFNGHGRLHNPIPGLESFYYNCWKSSGDVKQKATFIFHIKGAKASICRKATPSIQLRDIWRGKCDLTFAAILEVPLQINLVNWRKRDLWRDYQLVCFVSKFFNHSQFSSKEHSWKPQKQLFRSVTFLESAVEKQLGFP